MRKIWAIAIVVLAAALAPSAHAETYVRPLDRPELQQRVWNLVNATSPDDTRVQTYLQQYANGGGSPVDQQRARAALSRLAQGGQRPTAAPPYPLWRALGTVGLMAGAFELGWRIGRTVDTKWLHVAGDIGTWSGSPMIEGPPEGLQWAFHSWFGYGVPENVRMLQGKSSQGSILKAWAAVPESCTSYAPLCYGWNDWQGTTLEKEQFNREFYDAILAQSRGTLVMWGDSINGQRCWGTAEQVCVARYLTEQQFADLLWLKSPIVDWISQPWDRSTPHFAPAMPPWASPAWGEILDTLKSNEDLEDSINHELDPSDTARPYDKDDNRTNDDTSDQTRLCQWKGEPDESIGPGDLTWREMISAYDAGNPPYAAYYREECAAAWIEFFERGGTAAPGESRIPGELLWNDAAVELLQGLDQDIRHWVKYEIGPYQTPRGHEFVVHFYLNTISRQPFLGKDYKVIFTQYFEP